MQFIAVLAAVEVVAYVINLFLINGIVKKYHLEIQDHLPKNQT
jgi:hypothetical protein